MFFLRQVLGKSAKPIPIMILGAVVAGKRYPAVKYLFVVVISFGVGLFMFRRDEDARRTTTERILGVGEMLLVGLTLSS